MLSHVTRFWWSYALSTKRSSTHLQVLPDDKKAPKQAEVQEGFVHKWPKRRSNGESEQGQTSECKRLLD